MSSEIEIPPEPAEGPLPISLTISPTDEFFTAEKVVVRGWKGVTNSGRPAHALVSVVQLDADEPNMLGLKSVPPPVPTWSKAVNTGMGQLWQIAGRLSDVEVEHMVGRAMAQAAFRDPGAVEQTCANELCKERYRGPSMYCSLACAEIDH